MKAREILQKARCLLVVSECFYGTVTMQMHEHEAKSDREKAEIQTAGVAIDDCGKIHFYYNPDFIETLSVEQCYSLLIHECEHLIRLHPTRIHPDYHAKAWNVAIDMAINGHRSDPRCTYVDGKTGEKIVVTEDGCYVPPEWEDGLTGEEYYKLLMEEHSRENQESPAEGKGSPADNHDVMTSKTTASPDIARQVVEATVNKAKEASQGHVPGHLEQFLDKLSEPVVRWSDYLKNFLGRNFGGTRRTYARRNRRRDSFGSKGSSHRAVGIVGVIVDTSGSISDKDLQDFFSEIEAISHKASTWVLQWDTQFCGMHTNYRRGDWKDIKIGGRGGTHMDEAQNWVVENGVKADAVVMLTDGYTGWRQEPMGCPFFACITPDGTTEYSDFPEYAETIVMDKR